MRLALITDDGELVDAIEDIDAYDLSKPMTRADVIEDIERMVRRAKDEKA